MLRWLLFVEVCCCEIGSFFKTARNQKNKGTFRESDWKTKDCCVDQKRTGNWYETVNILRGKFAIVCGINEVAWRGLQTHLPPTQKTSLNRKAARSHGSRNCAENCEHFSTLSACSFRRSLWRGFRRISNCRYFSRCLASCECTCTIRMRDCRYLSFKQFWTVFLNI